MALAVLVICLNGTDMLLEGCQQPRFAACRFPCVADVFAPMRFAIILLLFALSWPTAAQEVAVAPAETGLLKISAREKWGLTMEQYALLDPSRRPSGDIFKYWKARKRGPYGNLLERVPGGPRRPVKL